MVWFGAIVATAVAVLSRCCTDPGCTVNHNRPERLKSRDDVQRMSVANHRLSISLWYLFDRHTPTQSEFHKSCSPDDLTISLAIGHNRTPQHMQHSRKTAGVTEVGTDQ